MPEILVANSFTVELPFCLGENLVDPDTDIDPRYARILLNYSTDDSGKVKLRGGRQKVSVRVPGKRFNSAMKFINLVGATSREYFFGTTAGDIYKFTLSTKAMDKQTLAASLTADKRCLDIMYKGKMYICNGTDQEQYYDGTSWTSYTDPPERFVDWCVAAGRIFAISKTTLYWSKFNCTPDGTNFASSPTLATGSSSRTLSTFFKSADEAVSIATVGQFLIVFGKENMAVFSIDEDQSGIVLYKCVGGVGIVGVRAHISVGTLFFWSTEGWRELIEAMTGETVRLDEKTPLRKNSPLIAARLNYIESNNLNNFIFCVPDQNRSRFLTLYPRKYDLSQMEFNIYNYAEGYPGWYRWDNHPVFCLLVDDHKFLLAGGDEYIYSLDEAGIGDEGNNIGGSGGALWEMPSYFFGKPGLEKVFDTMFGLMENENQINLTLEPFIDFGGQGAVYSEPQTIIIDPAGARYLEDTERIVGVYYDEKAYYSESGLGSREWTAPLSGQGKAYKPMIRYQGKSDHRFLFIALQGRKVE